MPGRKSPTASNNGASEHRVTNPASRKLGTAIKPEGLGNPLVMQKLGYPMEDLQPKSPLYTHHIASPDHKYHGINKTFEVNFRVRYTAEPGMTVIVIGSIPELDNWQKPGPHSHVLRKRGDVWESQRPLVTKNFYFHYKYALVKDNFLQAWERGVDRVADLEIMASASKVGESFNPCDYFFGMEDETRGNYWGGVKPIQFNETWEKLWVSFMVFHKTLDPQEQLLFTCESIGVHKRPMNPMARDFNWMNSKYDTELRPYQIEIEFDNKESEEGQFKGHNQFQYSYSVRSRFKAEIIERQPQRSIILQDPNKYHGTLGSSNSTLWLNTDRVWNVNGIVFMADGNFLNHFFVQRIGQTPISVGSYPSNQHDFSRLRQHGSNAVLNIMDTSDHRMHGFSPDELKRQAIMGGFDKSNVWHCPVSDVHLESYCSTAFQAILQLHKMVNVQNLDVFVYCGAGVSRSSTIWIAFIALFGLSGVAGGRNNDLEDDDGIFKPNAIVFKNVKSLVNNLARYLQTYHGLAMPNLKAVFAIIDANKDYVEEQRKRLALEEEIRRREEEERLRQLALEEARRKYAEAKRIREKEEQEEMMRLKRWNDAKAERDQRYQRDLDELERKYNRKFKEEEERLRQKQAQYDRNLAELKRRIAEEQAHRETEKKRLSQEALLQEEKVRLQKLAIEAARDAARIKREQEAMEDTERKRRLAIAKDEADRQRREREIADQEKRHKLRLRAEELENQRLEEIRLTQHQAEQLKVEIQSQEETQLLYRRKQADEEDAQLAKERQAAREEAARLTERLRQLDIDSQLSSKKKNIKDWTVKVAQDRMQKIKAKPTTGIKEREAVRIKQSYNFERNMGAFNTPMGNDHDTPGTEMFDLEQSNFGLTEEDFNHQVSELFDVAPIQFLPGDENAEIDQAIQKEIEQSYITIPIVHITDQIYFVGTERVVFELDAGRLMVMKKAGATNKQPFESFIGRKQYGYKKELIKLMLQANESLEYIVDRLIEGKDIPNVHLEAVEKAKLTGTKAAKFKTNIAAKAIFQPASEFAQSIDMKDFNADARAADQAIQNALNSGPDFEKLLHK